VRPDAGTLALGKTSQAEVTQKLGSPFQTGDVMKNEKQIKVTKYAYAQSTGEGAYSGVVPARAMTFGFFDDKLVSQDFTSSFKADSTDFDGAKVATITKGKTKKDEVIALLGKATGEATYPVIKSTTDKALTYSYAQAKGSVFNMKFHTKTLVVSYNETGLVTDVEYTASGDQ
jgi:hypothetical protein